MAVQRAEAVYNFDPTADVELQLKKGDVVTVHRTGVGDGWLEGELNGRRGLFPSSFVKMLPVSPQHATLPPPPPPPTGANPRLSRKLCMENLLAPCGVTSFCPDKAAEIFVQGREEIHVMAGPKWDASKTTPLTISVSYCHSEGQSEVKVLANYNVKTKELSSHVTRNYKHFLNLYNRFAECFPCISLPPLPVKQITSSSDLVALETRRRRLEKFLARVARHPLLGATKVFYDFLTANDEKDWKIGKPVKVTKSSKKIFQAPIYYVVQYPLYNIPVNQLSSIERFCAFSVLAKENFEHIHQSYQQHGMAEAEVMTSLNNLGHDLKRFSKGLQPVVDAQHRKVQALVSNTVAGDTVDQDSSDEGEQTSWNWREDPKFTHLVHYLSDVGYGIQDVAGVYRDHQEKLDQAIVESFAEYSSIFHTLPDMVRLHEEAMEVFNASKEKDSKKEAEEVREHCDTLSNILMAEFDHISNGMSADLQSITTRFLRLQADFHSKLAMKWQSLYDKHRRSTDDTTSVDGGDLWNISRPSSSLKSSPASSRKASSPVPEDNGESIEGEAGGGMATGREVTDTALEAQERGGGGGGGGGGSSMNDKGDYEVPKFVVGKEAVPEEKHQEVDCSHYKNWQFALMLEKKKEVTEPSSSSSTSSLKGVASEQAKKPCPPPKVLKQNQDDYSVPWDIQGKLAMPMPPVPPPAPPPEPSTTAGLVPTWYSKVTVAPDKPPTTAVGGADNDRLPTSDPTTTTTAVVQQQAQLPKQTSRSSMISGKKQPLLPPKKPSVYKRAASKDSTDDGSSDGPLTSSGQHDSAALLPKKPSVHTRSKDLVNEANLAPSGPPDPTPLPLKKPPVITRAVSKEVVDDPPPTAPTSFAQQQDVPPTKPPHVALELNKAKTRELLARLAARKPKAEQPSPSPEASPAGDYVVRYVPEKDSRDSSDSAVVVTYAANNPGKEDRTGEEGGGGEGKSNLAKYGIIEDGGGTYTV